MHVLLAAIVPLENEIEPAAATGEYVGEPHPLVVAFGVGATTIVAGNVSEKATPLCELFWFGFTMEKVRVDTPPSKIGFGANCLDISGGSIAVMDADATPVGPVLVPVSADAINPLTLL